MANREPSTVTPDEMDELVKFMRARAIALSALSQRFRDEEMSPKVQNMGGVERWRKSIDGLIRNLKRELGEV